MGEGRAGPGVGLGWWASDAGNLVYINLQITCCNYNAAASDHRIMMIVIIDYRNMYNNRWRRVDRSRRGLAASLHSESD